METFVEKVARADEVVREALHQHENIVVASSFGKDSMVVLDLVRRHRPDIPVFTVFMDTEFPETVEFSRGVAKDWRLNYEEHIAVQGRDVALAECCGAPKVEKHREALRDYDAWFSGIRKTEGITRATFDFFEQRGSLLKINPILEFTELDVWRYIATRALPVNPKYAEGYRSLGCALCTVPEKSAAMPERQGRWEGTVKEGGECGIHTQVLKA